jgi:preprotein translocase subunit YajC
MSFLPMILIFVAFYFLLIAPQRKKQKQHEKMIQSLEKGAKVKTIGGMFGTITGVKDDCFVIRIAENVKVEISKEAVSAKID